MTYDSAQVKSTCLSDRGPGHSCEGDTAHNHLHQLRRSMTHYSASLSSKKLCRPAALGALQLFCNKQGQHSLK